MQRFDGINQLIAHEWMAESITPSYAWVRYILCCGVKPEAFGATYKQFKVIRQAFGRRALILPVNFHPHNSERIDFEFSASQDDGGLKVGISDSKLHIPGGPHFLIVVESDEAESGNSNAKCLEITDAIEALLRCCLGANAVFHVNGNYHMKLPDGEFGIVSDDLHLFGAEESTRTDENSISLVGEMLAAYESIPAVLRMRFLLAFSWINKAFREHELIYYLTAFEILAGSYKKDRVYKLLADAYAFNKPQKFAIKFHLEHIYKLRHNYIHNGRYVSMTPVGSSYLLAIFHDMARKLAGLECNEYADRIRKSKNIRLEFAQ